MILNYHEGHRLDKERLKMKIVGVGNVLVHVMTTPPTLYILPIHFIEYCITEFDECSLSNHGCDHLCMNQLGSYSCECKIGYEIHSDGKRCEGKLFCIIFSIIKQNQLKI